LQANRLPASIAPTANLVMIVEEVFMLKAVLSFSQSCFSVTY
jgi:hypothetical protein